MNCRLNVFLVSLIAVMLLAFSGLFSEQGVRVWIFDVGQGDAIFIDAPHQQMLIDGGPDALVLERLAAVMPWWDRSIDVVVNTHPHADHVVGLISVLERYQVQDMIDGGEGYNTPEFAEYLRLAGVSRRIISASEVIELGDGATLTTLWPAVPYADAVLEDPNDGSVVFLFEYGQTSILLTGDAGLEEELEWEVRDVDILKVGHHGSETSTSQELLDRTTPEVAIISVGEDNNYGHPSRFVIERLLRAGINVLRTDQNGNVRIRSLGLEPKVKTLQF